MDHISTKQNKAFEDENNLAQILNAIGPTAIIVALASKHFAKNYFSRNKGQTDPMVNNNQET